MRYLAASGWRGAILLIASCKPPASHSDRTECAPGARGCPCDAGGSCHERPTCRDGFSVSAADGEPRVRPEHGGARDALVIIDGVTLACES